MDDSTNQPWVMRTLIVSDEYAFLASQLCEGMAGPGGSGMFKRGLSPTGAEPATHRISSGYIDSAFLPLLASPSLLYRCTKHLGSSLELCEALLANAVVTDEDPFVVLERMGLQLVDQTS